MKKVLLLVYPTFSEFEIAVAAQVLSKEFEVVSVAPRPGLVTGEAGLWVHPHLTVDQIDVNEYEAFVIPGAEDLIHIKNEDAVFVMVQKFAEQGKVIGAICGGPYVLLRAGVLDSTPYTVAFTQDQREFLGFPETGYIASSIVEATNLITAQGYAFAEFGLRLGEKLGITISSEAQDFFHGRPIQGFGNVRQPD